MKRKIKKSNIKALLINQKGFALLTTLIFVFILSTLGVALLTMTSSDIKLSTLQRDSTEAFYLADSGIDRALAWLQQHAAPSETYINNNFNPYVGTLSTGTYTVNIYSDANNPNTFTKKYTIKSTGVAGVNNSTRKIESVVQVRSFAGYAYFSDEELFPNNPDIPHGFGYAGGTIWFGNNDVIGGKLHSNDQIHIYGNPTFKGKVTSAAESIDYWAGEGSYTEEEMLAMFEQGKQLGVARIDLPQYRAVTDPDNPKSLQRIAWGSSSSVPTTNGVYVPNDGNNVTAGIYVKGDIDDLSLGLNAGNSETTINQISTINTITTITNVSVSNSITLPAGTILDGSPLGASYTVPQNTTLIKTDETASGGNIEYTNHSGITNGLLYSHGKIKKLHGTQKGKLTIAAHQDIIITDDVVYDSMPENPDYDTLDYTSITDTLGLITEGDVIVSEAWAPYDIQINAVMMVLGTSFFYEGWYDKYRGTLGFYGSFIQKQRGPVGTFYSSTGQKRSGYTKNYYYDQRMSSSYPGMSDSLPPYFPTTGNYDRLSWREVT